MNNVLAGATGPDSDKPNSAVEIIIRSVASSNVEGIRIRQNLGQSGLTVMSGRVGLLLESTWSCRAESSRVRVMTQPHPESMQFDESPVIDSGVGRCSEGPCPSPTLLITVGQHYSAEPPASFAHVTQGDDN